MAEVKAGAPPSGRRISRIRFMQMALATAILFCLAYMYQFVSVSVSLRSAEDSEDSRSARLMRNRVLSRSVLQLQGFENAHKFITEYDVEIQGPLYILFMSDVDENNKYWCPDCERAKKPVMDAFNRAPRGSRLVEIRVGSQSYWGNYMNEFRQSELFYLDHIPALMRYEGGGISSTMLIESFCTDPALLDFVFRVNKPLAGEPNNNKVLTMYSPEEVINYLETYDNSYPLFLFFVSGYHDFNGRLWCPYSDRANVPVMHYYNYTAPDNAVMVRVIVADTYKKWKKDNPFKLPEFQKKVAPVQELPVLAFVRKDVPNNVVSVYQFTPDYSETGKLQVFFKNKPQAANPSRANPPTASPPKSKPVVAKPRTGVPWVTPKPPAAKPKVAGKPKGTAKPKVAGKPKATAKPKVAGKPKATAKPKVAGKPKAAGKPKVTAKPRTVRPKPN